MLTGATAKLQFLKEKLHNVKKMITDKMPLEMERSRMERKEVRTLICFLFHGLSAQTQFIFFG